MEMHCISCKWHTSTYKYLGVLCIYSNNLPNNFSYYKSWNTQAHGGLLCKLHIPICYCFWFSCLSTSYTASKGLPSQDLGGTGVYTVESGPSELYRLLDDFILYIPALSVHAVTLWLAWTGCTSVSVTWSSCTWCMHWTMSCQRYRKWFSVCLQIVVHERVGCKLLVHSFPLPTHTHTHTHTHTPHTHTHTHTHTHIHTHTFLCYSPGQALVSWLVFLLVFLVSTMPMLSCIVRMVTHFLSCHFTAIILWVYMAVASPFSGHCSFSSSGIFFLLSLLSSWHLCLPPTASQRELEMNTSCLYTICNLWIGREPSTPSQQPQVQGDSDPQLAAHCIF